MKAKRQQRKLNFLITQTELYAHFMSRKMGSTGQDSVQERILNQLNEEVMPSSLIDDDDDYGRCMCHDDIPFLVYCKEDCVFNSLSIFNQQIMTQ